MVPHVAFLGEALLNQAYLVRPWLLQDNAHFGKHLQSEACL